LWLLMWATYAKEGAEEEQRKREKKYDEVCGGI
jgi:hypothetical protein